MPSGHGTNPGLQEATQRGQYRLGKQCQDKALKLHELHGRCCPGEFTSECEVEWKHSVFLFENLADPLLRASLRSKNAEGQFIKCQCPLPSSLSQGCSSACPDGGGWGGGSHQTRTWDSCWLGDSATAPQELAAQVRRVDGDGLWPRKAAHRARGRANQKGHKKAGEMKAGTGNDLALMGSTPHWNKGHRRGALLRGSWQQLAPTNTNVRHYIPCTKEPTFRQKVGGRRDVCPKTTYKMYDHMSLRDQVITGGAAKAIRRRHRLSKALRLIWRRACCGMISQWPNTKLRSDPLTTLSALSLTS